MASSSSASTATMEAAEAMNQSRSGSELGMEEADEMSSSDVGEESDEVNTSDIVQVPGGEEEDDQADPSEASDNEVPERLNCAGAIDRLRRMHRLIFAARDKEQEPLGRLLGEMEEVLERLENIQRQELPPEYARTLTRAWNQRQSEYRNALRPLEAGLKHYVRRYPDAPSAEEVNVLPSEVWRTVDWTEADLGDPELWASGRGPRPSSVVSASLGPWSSDPSPVEEARSSDDE